MAKPRKEKVAGSRAVRSQRPQAPRRKPNSGNDQQVGALEAFIGRQVRATRMKFGMKVANLAVSAKISIGMLSKIENGIISPSLRTLKTLSDALGVPMISFFRRSEEERKAILLKAGEGLDVERRGARTGHQYKHLGQMGLGTKGMLIEPYLISLAENSEGFPTFRHEGIEFIYLVEGEVVYRHGRQRYHLRRGDSLLFDPAAPHGPVELTKLPMRYLSISCYQQSDVLSLEGRS